MENMDYDVGKAFAAIENELLDSMMRNMKRHRVEETKEGFQWEQWQAKQLAGLEEYRRKHKGKLEERYEAINSKMRMAILQANAQGKMAQEKKILEAIRKGAKLHRATDKLQGEFFRVNDRKMNALLDAVESDMKRAESAILRMHDDKTRRAIFNAQVYANSGAGTYEKAVDMAVKDYAAAGINCVRYKDGKQVNIKSYARMALKTAGLRAYLTGEGTKRQEWGIHTVIINKRGNPCPLCLPWVGRVMIDDVWSGGTAAEAKKMGYPLISQAMNAGLYHPNCRDSHTTYFPGISTPPDKKWKKSELAAIEKNVKQEARWQYAERQKEKFDRLERCTMDPDDQGRYAVKKKQWEKTSNTLKEKKEDDILKLKNEITDMDIHLDTLKEKFEKITDGYSYDDWFKEFESIEEGFGDVSGDNSFNELKEIDAKIKDFEKQKSTLLLRKEKRKQLDTGFTGKVPDNEFDNFNKKAFEQIKLDTGYSDEKAKEFQDALNEYFGGDYESILTGEGTTAKVIREGIDRMPVYDGTTYRGLYFSESSDYDISQFTNLKSGDKIPSKGIISSWSSDKMVAEAFGGASTKSAESSTVILECTNNKTGVGVQHLSKFGVREAEVLSGTDYEVVEITKESKYDYVSKRKDLLYFPDDLDALETELKNQIVCTIKVKEV